MASMQPMEDMMTQKELMEMLWEAATLLEGCRGYFAYQTAQGDQFAPDAKWEAPIIRFLDKYKTFV